MDLSSSPKKPVELIVSIGSSSDRELQVLTALTDVMNHYYPSDSRSLGDAAETWRIAEYFHSRYGVNPAHVTT